MLIFWVWNKILKIWDALFEPIETETQCSKNHFKISLSQESGASGNNIEKEPQKSRPKLNEYIYIYIKYSQRIFALPAIWDKW